MNGRFLLLLLWLSTPWAAAQDSFPVQQVKAAFLLRFTTYVDWPAGAFEAADAPLVIGVLADEDLRTSLAQLLTAQSREGRPVETRRLRDGDTLAGLHVLFVGTMTTTDTAALLAEARERGILTVTDEAAPQRVGMINFVVQDDHLAFDVTMADVELADLRLSSRLLQVARRIEVEP